MLIEVTDSIGNIESRLLCAASAAILGGIGKAKQHASKNLSWCLLRKERKCIWMKDYDVNKKAFFIKKDAWQIKAK